MWFCFSILIAFELIPFAVAKGGASTNQDFDKALKEMMARIESGKALKPVLKTRTVRMRQRVWSLLYKFIH